MSTFRLNQYVMFDTPEGSVLGEVVERPSPGIPRVYKVSDGMDTHVVHESDMKKIDPQMQKPKIERGPFAVPRRSVMRQVDVHTVACIQTMTLQKVMGLLVVSKGTLAGTYPFHVKHNGTRFNIGSGSSKSTFYFSDWERLPG